MGMGFAPIWLRQVSPHPAPCLLHKTTLTTARVTLTFTYLLTYLLTYLR